MESRTVATKRNVAFGALRSAVTLLLSFVTRTVLIRTFGVEYVGLNSLFVSLLQVLNLAELGFGSAVVFSLYRPLAEDDAPTVHAYLAFYRKVYRIVGLTILAAGILLIPVLPLLIRKGMPTDLSLQSCWLIFLADTSLSYLLFGYLTAIPTAIQRGDVLSRIDTVTAIAKSAAQIAMLACHAFYGYLLVIPLMTLARNLLVARQVRARFPQYAFPELADQNALSPAQRQDLRKRIAGLFVQKLFGTTRNGIDALCISAFVGLAAVGIYNNYFLILSALVSISTILTQAMIPSVGNSIVTESVEKNYRDMRRFDFMYTAIAGWATCCLLCLWQPFMRLWVGEELMLGWPEVCGLALYFYIAKSGSMWYIYAEALGLWWEMRHVSVTEAVANVALNAILCRWRGVLGVILATLLTLFFLNFIPCPILLWRNYFPNRSVYAFFREHALWLVTSIPGAAACLVLCALPAQGIIGLAIRATICVVVYPACWWFLWHRSPAFAEVQDWLLRAK